ncbi:hypothetical protein OBBRIDRAFT_795075, partial [Obba rivulosa]
MRAVCHIQIPECQGLLSSENGSRCMMFRHAVFEPLTDANAYMEDELALVSQYCIEGWHAYDMHGALIPPSEYVQKLRGAVVVVCFNVAVYVFGQVPKHRHRFIGDIMYIHVLVPPTAPSAP